MYSPTLGRFMQTDPVGYKDQVNLYEYVGDDPVDYVDPSGTSGIDIALEQLNQQLVSGQISQQQYRERRDALVNGGLIGLSTIPVDGLAAEALGWLARALDFGTTERLVIGKLLDIADATKLKPGEYTLPGEGRLPDLGSPRENWAQNARELRKEMQLGRPIRDASVDPKTGALRDNTGFLKAERNQLSNARFKYDSKTQTWNPPKEVCTGSRIPGAGTC